MWNWGRRHTPVGEEQIYRQGLQTIWRNTVYNVRYLAPFSYYEWPGYDNGYSDIFVTKNWSPGRHSRKGALLRDSIACLPVSFRRARRFGKLLKETRFAPREVVILQPSTSTLNAYPYYSISDSFNVHTIEAKTFHDLLFNKNYQYGYVLEESLFDGKVDLEDFPVVILPYATHFPDGLNGKLLKFIRRGGTMICSGVPGLYDAYGRDDGSLVREVFGDIEVRYKGNDYLWLYQIQPRALKPQAQVLVADGQSALLLSAAYGKGRILISAMPFGQRLGSHRLLPHFYRAVDEALGGQKVRTDYDRFEVVVRQGGGGREFLFVLNHSLSNALEDRILVKGKYRRAYDLGIGQTFAIPLLPTNIQEALKMPHDWGVFYVDNHSPKGYTSFWLKLEPGEGTAVELVK